MAGPNKTDRQVSRLLDKEDEQGILALVRDGAVGADDPVTYAPPVRRSGCSPRPFGGAGPTSRLS